MSKRKRQLESKQYAKCPDCGRGNLVICEKAEDVKNVILYHANESEGKPKLKCPVCKNQIGFEVIKE